MTDTIPTPATADTELTGPADSTTDTTDLHPTGTDGTDTAPDDTEAPDANNEAKKYRKRAQAAEAERDQLRTRLDTLQRAEVGRLASTHGEKIHNTEDLFEIGGVVLEDLKDDDGNLDPAKVAASLEALHTERPYLFVEKRFPNLMQGERDTIKGRTTWASALKQ